MRHPASSTGFCPNSGIFTGAKTVSNEWSFITPCSFPRHQENGNFFRSTRAYSCFTGIIGATDFRNVVNHSEENTFKQL